MANSSPSIIIRHLDRCDRAAWLPLWRGYLAFYESTGPLEIADLTFDRLVDPNEPLEGALAFVDRNAVGLVHLVSHSSTWTRGNYGYLQDLFTAENARGRGVGRALIEYVYGRAKALGCARVHWLTQETNTSAIALYEQVADRSGFLQYRKTL